MFILILTVHFKINALTVKEKIQEELSKVGIKQEITDETVKLDKEIGNIGGLHWVMTDTIDKNRKNEIKSKWEKLFLKDRRNYIALEKVIITYGNNNLLESEKGKKYISEYLKADIPEDRKNFLLGISYFVNRSDETLENEYFEKVKSESDNQYYIQIADLLEYLNYKNSKDEVGNSKLNEEEKRNRVLKVIAKLDGIDEILENGEMRRKYRISDEEAYSIQLDNFLIRSSAKKAVEDTEGLLNDFISHIADRKISREIAEYNAEKEATVYIFVLKIATFGKRFSEERNIKAFKEKELLKKIKKTDFYKRVKQKIK